MSYEEFAPEELAQIAKEYFANCSEEIDYLVQQNELFGQWEKVTELWEAGNYGLAPQAQATIEHKLERILDQLKASLIPTPMGLSADAQEQFRQGYLDVAHLAVIKGEKNLLESNPTENSKASADFDPHAELYFSAADRTAATTAQLQIPKPAWWQLPTDAVRLQRGLAKAVDTVRGNIVSEYANRAQGRGLVMEQIKQYRKKNQATFKRLHSEMASLNLFLQGLSTAHQVTHQNRESTEPPTPNQLAQAKQCQTLATTMLAPDADYNRLEGEFLLAKQALDQALALESRANTVEQVITELLGYVPHRLDEARRINQGIVEMLAYLPDHTAKSAAIKTTSERLHKALATATEASEETMRVLQTVQTKLQQHRTNPTVIEPLVDAWERENLGAVYMTSFNQAMTDFMNVHMELGSILRSSDSAVKPFCV